MIKTFKNKEIVSFFNVESGKVLTVVEINGINIINPTIEQFKNAGWEECESPDDNSLVPTLEELVEKKIRERYSLNQEFLIQRKRDNEPEAFKEYYNYVEECITWAKNQLNKEYPYGDN